MEDKPKAEEKIREEGQAQKAEAERSLAVALAKYSHGLIEQTERSRKRHLVASLLLRIIGHSRAIQNFVSIILHVDLQRLVQFPPNVEIEAIVSGLIETYKSIRQDLLNINEKGREDVEKLFPERPTDYKNINEAFFRLIAIHEQEEQISNYLIRYLL